MNEADGPDSSGPIDGRKGEGKPRIKTARCNKPLKNSLLVYAENDILLDADPAVRSAYNGSDAACAKQALH